MWYIIGAIALFCVCFYFYFGHIAVMLFWKCMKLDVKISYIELAKMKKNNVNIDKLLKYAIKLKEEGGYDVKIKDMMQHEQSGGDMTNVVNLLLTAKRKKTVLTYQQAAIMDMDEINKKRKNIEKQQKQQQEKEEAKANEQAQSENTNAEEVQEQEQVKEEPQNQEQTQNKE